MLNRIIRFSLHNRLFVLVAAVLLLIGGTYTAYHTEVDVFPDLNAPTVVVMTEAGGMAAEEVEQLVTFPVETAVNGATHVRRVRSSSTHGFSVVWVEFEWGTDIYLARQIVSEKLAVVSEQLPAGVGNPTLGPQSSILGELLIVGLTADSTSMLDLRTLADWTIRPRLLSTGGVAQVAVLGGDVKEYQILPDPARMRHYGVSLDDVLAATREMNQNANGGVLSDYGNAYIVRGMVATHRVEALRQAVVKSRDGRPVTLAEVADVCVGGKEPRLGTASVRGQSAVLLTVTKQPNTSTLDLTARLDQVLAELQPSLPADVQVHTDIFRQSRFIERSIGNVKKSLFEGGLFVVLVLVLFLGNVRTTLISLLTLPLSLVAALLTLHLLGLTINTMSLGGLAIAIGSLVDDAIVDVENVWRHLQANRQLPPERRAGIVEVVYQASREVRMPILNSTLIIVASFVPLFFLSGLEGRMLVPLGIAFIVALFASTVVALTLTPVLCSYLLQPHRGEKALRESAVATWAKRIYERALRSALRHKRAWTGGTAVGLVGALVCFCLLGRNFLPPFNEGSFTINVSTLPGVSLDESDRLGRQAEAILLSIPEIQTVARKTGRAELDEHAMGVNVSEIEAPFELADRSRDEVLTDVRSRLSALAGASIEIGQPISHRIDAMLSGTKASIAIKVFGPDLNRLFALGHQIRRAVADVEGIADLNVEQQIERPQLQLVPRREMLAQYGITLPAFAEYVRVALAGEAVSQVYEDGRTFDLVVRFRPDVRDRLEYLADITLDADGRKIPLSEVADLVSAAGPDVISRENVQRKIVVSANTAGRDVHSVVADIRDRIAREVILPEGYHIAYGGQFESEQAASRTLLLASLLSLMVVALLLYQEFRSLRQSAIILLGLPLSLIGGVFSLVVTGGDVSIPAVIGFISLVGIATRGGMLLVSHYNLLRRQGLPLYECVMQGSLDRLNPILMTALSSALALIPLALAGSQPGGEIQSPMAKVILGGLLSSTLLNGFLVPIVYYLTHTKHDTHETK